MPATYSPRLLSLRIPKHFESTAIETRLSIKEQWRGEIKTLPIRGGKAAHFRKLDPDDSLPLNIDELEQILEGATPDQCMAVLRALLRDARQEGRVQVCLPGADAHLASLARAFAEVVQLSGCDEAKRVRRAVEGLNARAAVLARAEVVD